LEPLASGYLEGNELVAARQRAREELGCSPRTLRRKLQTLKIQGLASLSKRPRKDKGASRTVSPDLVSRVCDLIKENPARSVRKALALLKLDSAFCGQVQQITTAGVYRYFIRHGIDLARVRGHVSTVIRRSFAADFANQMWQADSRVGISLPDPHDPKKRKVTKLFVWLDDYSRYVIYGRYYFDETLPHLEASFRQAILRHGLPQRLYCDNGSTYISRHFTLVTESLGVRKIHHPPYCAYCKGKVESFNKFVKGDFQSEAQAADIRTLDELNSAFDAWCELDYNRRVHSETGEKPRDRYLTSIAKISPRRVTDIERFERLFLWREVRIVDKYGILSFETNLYRVSGCSVGERIEIRYNPFDLGAIELWRNGQFVEISKANKVERLRVKVMPEEHQREKGAEISQSAQRYFAKLREQLTQERAEGADTMKAFLKLKEI
jgi:transposase InsO family protein